MFALRALASDQAGNDRPKILRRCIGTLARFRYVGIATGGRRLLADGCGSLFPCWSIFERSERVERCRSGHLGSALTSGAHWSRRCTPTGILLGCAPMPQGATSTDNFEWMDRGRRFRAGAQSEDFRAGSGMRTAPEGPRSTHRGSTRAGPLPHARRNSGDHAEGSRTEREHAHLVLVLIVVAVLRCLSPNTGQQPSSLMPDHCIPEQRACSEEADRPVALAISHG